MYLECTSVHYAIGVIQSVLKCTVCIIQYKGGTVQLVLDCTVYSRGSTVYVVLDCTVYSQSRCRTCLALSIF